MQARTAELRVLTERKWPSRLRVAEGALISQKRRKKNRGDDDEEAIQADSSFASVQQEWTLPTQENRYQVSQTLEGAS